MMHLYIHIYIYAIFKDIYTPILVLFYLYYYNNDIARNTNKIITHVCIIIEHELIIIIIKEAFI